MTPRYISDTKSHFFPKKVVFEGQKQAFKETFRKFRTRLGCGNFLPFIWSLGGKFVRFASKIQYIENSLTVHETVHRILWMWMFWNLKVPTLPYHTSLFSGELKTNENVRFPLEINRRISIFLPYACCQGGDWFKWGKKFTDRQASRKRKIKIY